MVIVLAAAILLPVNSVVAENIVSSGTTVRVTGGTSIVSQSAITLRNGSTLTNLGTIILSGNLNNENAVVSNLGAGTVSMSGTALQNINGQNSFGNLTMNNTAGVNLNGNTSVNGILTLTSGRLSLGANNLLLGSSATIAGAPSASAMVVATSTGEIRKSYSGPGTFIFPVGDNSGVAEYSPVTIAFTSGSFASVNYVGVNVTNSPYPGVTGSFINRYWRVTRAGISGFNSNATFKYVPADVVGTESLMYCLRVTPTSVIYFSPANIASDLLTANGINDFGTFTGVQQLANKTLNLSALLEGLYNGSGTMRKAQNAVGDQFPGSTADQISIELHNGTNYGNILFTVSNVNLSTTGNSTVSIPGLYSGSYYLTLRHRNSIETTTSTPVSFAAGTTNYTFNNPTKAYGGNLLLMIDGFYVVYGGDVNQDGAVDTSDMTPVDNQSANFITGYVPTDCNGDGTVDTGDMSIVDNNSASFVSAITPP